MIPKFRAWLKEELEMQDVLAFDTRGHSFLGIEGSHVTVSDWCDVFEVGRQAILMQSTGLKDKNGVEIFEGDIVQHRDGEYSYLGIVKRDCYQFFIDGIEPDENYDFIDVSNTFDGTSSLEILGNIWDNKELLEVAE
ncbi:hypothetical protein K0I80_000244 [Enterococcus faecalis]|nr:hypothetical protein [Enterococcus faecalis]EGO8804095.1 hypothetical protein [Enterococcus faecalis]EGO9046515.1 hypothetical protein [Enterococcus faecalis]EHV2935984.1 hypothetical protein [Enterococcus faecalis]EMC0699183.1 hypothetical protein [Enterococcus faecalis]